MVDSVTNTTTSSDESQTNQNQGTTTLWQVDIFPVAGQPNRLSAEVLDNARDLRVDESLEVIAAHGFLIQGSLTHEDLARLTSDLLVEPVVERCEFALVGSESLSQPMGKLTNLLHVLPLPGVTDPQAESALMAMRHLGFPVDVVRTFKKFWTSALSETDQNLLHGKILCNDSIEMIVVGKLELDELQLGQAYEFSKRDIPLTDLPDEALMKISQDWTLSLSL